MYTELIKKRNFKVNIQAILIFILIKIKFLINY